ncbi:nucleoside monophosphate kinase [Candidatus Roizmanbacteria bacterium]|nr:nucleoside monophosphate kinase [Candidatus Roizmanbacteria bacterium]
MKLVLLGIQGAGKSTQGNLLSRQLKIPYLSTGHIFREIAKEKTTLGRYVKETVNAGILVPDDKTIAIVHNYLTKPEYRNGYILDGFPRTLRQAREFKNNVDKVIYLEIPDKDAIYRLVYRNDSKRADETLPAIKKRIESFHKFTRPVLDYFREQNKLVELDATKSIKEVNEEILKSLGRQLIKDQIKVWERKQKAIIAIVGLAGSGKTEAAHFFKQKNIPVISFGKIINDYIDTHKLPHSEEIHKKIRMEIREKHGMEAMALLNEKEIKDALENNTIIVTEGLQSWEEYLYLKKKFTDVKVYILSLHADKEIRYKRIAKRKYRSKLHGEERDINELVGTNKGPAIAFADFLIKNNYSLEDLHDKLESVYRTVYFS